MGGLDPTRRFSNRVEDYVRYRPDYPPALFDLLGRAVSVVELGAGTGILTRQLLERGHRVYAVEPNRAMARAQEPHERLVDVDGSAEDTGLDAGIADIVVAAQAFHWFEPRAARLECQRLLRGGGSVFLVWNNRTSDTDAMRDYEALLRRHGTDYDAVARKDPWTGVSAFFGGRWDDERLPHSQALDREGLRGRIRSCSYVPAEGQPGHEAMLEDADRLFEAYSSGGTFDLRYETMVLFSGVP